MSIRFFPAHDIPSLDGKHILVTGATSGLGLQSVLDLAAHSPALIYLCGRTLEKAQATIDQVVKPALAPNSTTVLQPLALELSSFASVKAAAHVVLDTSPRLDILMLNGGIMAASPGLSEDGYEISMATNHLSHALLTSLLLPLLRRTSSPRVICLSSRGHASVPNSLGLALPTYKTTAEEVGTWGRYFQTKLANVLWVRYMARQHQDDNILFVAIHPGLARTSLLDKSDGANAIIKLLVRIGYNLLPTAQDAVKNQLWAATAKDGVVSGEYYEPVGLGGKASAFGTDDNLAKTLGEWTDEEIRAAVSSS